MTSSNAPRSSETKAPVKLPPRKSWLRRQFSDIFYVAKRDKKWWLLPIIFALLVLAALLLTASSLGPLAPFIYPFL